MFSLIPNITQDERKKVQNAEEIAEEKSESLWKGCNLQDGDILSFPEDGGLYYHDKGYLERHGTDLLINGIREAAIPARLVKDGLRSIKTGSEIRFPQRFHQPILKVHRIGSNPS